MQLEDKVAIITGASSGIGKASAVLFARHGARVVLGARRRQGLEAVADEIIRAGGRVAWLAGDVCDEAYAAALVELADERFGGVDIGFNNAGSLGALGPLEAMQPGNWDGVMVSNLTSAFHAAQAQVPAMRKRGGGSLIFTSSFVGFESGLPGMSAYGAAKSGLVGLARCLAVELGPDGIRVNALLPGGTDTPMAAEFAGTPEAKDHVRSLHALKRIAEPEEIARAALFLASDQSSFVTGSAMLADGGNSVCKG